MGRRLRQVRKRFSEVVRATQRVFVMCKCRMKIVYEEEETAHGDSLSRDRTASQNDMTSTDVTCSDMTSTNVTCSDTATTVGVPASPCPRTNSQFTWHCLGQGNSLLPPNTMIWGQSNIHPRLHFATGPRWEAITPGIVQVKKKFTHGAMGQVELVSFGRERFVRKKVSEGKGQYEASITIDAQCEFVAKLNACFSQRNAVYLHMQYYGMKDLLYWLKKDKHRVVFTEEVSVWMTLHILTALLVIHSKGIIHMDIKPSNILISDRGYPLLVDFGASIRTCDPLRLHCATEAYLCPELQHGQSQRAERIRNGMTDMWAASIILCQMTTGYRPYTPKSFRTWYLKEIPARTHMMKRLSPMTRDFLSSALEIDPTKRLGFEDGVIDLLHHELFMTSDWESLGERMHTDIKSHLFDKLVALQNTS